MIRTYAPLALAITLATLAGCSSKPTEPEKAEFTGIELEFTEFAPDMREHHTSWGHEGRGGAALRKPTYQHVLSSEDQISTRYGKLYPELQPKQPTAAPATIAVPQGILASNCNSSESAQVFAAPISTLSTTGGIALARAEANAPVDEYLKVRKKLCAGSQRLSYEEWLILVNGTPKDIPLHLQPKPYSVK
ncbi:MAG: hypothetical protein UV01_C0002G0120 [Parcubacteria group bacterium GW2011_GWA2_42_14]|nr:MULTISPECIES: hypothetical protein [Pseudomonas]KKS38812.1 MAG: hypothetical protein UV01_C0002G0120 [Parcubacteria group bacterium GW2011_GWA2_42_14]OEO25104.1 hypothetical protein AX279_13525 [Pseudomonas sp. J237]